VMTLCKASLIGFSAPFRSSANYSVSKTSTFLFFE